MFTGSSLRSSLYAQHSRSPSHATASISYEAGTIIDASMRDGKTQTHRTEVACSGTHGYLREDPRLESISA